MNFPGTLGFLKIFLVFFLTTISRNKLLLWEIFQWYKASNLYVLFTIWLKENWPFFHKKHESIVDSVLRSLFSKLIIDWIFNLLHCSFILILIITTFNWNNLEKTDGISKEFSFKTRPVKWILMWFLTFSEKRHKITQQV